MKKIYFLQTVLFLTFISLNAQVVDYNATSPALNTSLNNFIMHFDTGLIPSNATVKLTLTVSGNTSKDNRDIIYLGNASQLTGLGNAYPIYGPTFPVTVEYDITSAAVGHNLAQEDILYSGDAYQPYTKKNFTFGTITFSNIKLTVTTPTLSVPNIENSSPKVSIYPNPSCDYIQILNLTKIENYKIYNMLGAEINSGTILNNKINITGLTNGLYFLKIENGNLLKFIKK